VDRRAFRRLAFALHPDRHPHLSDAEKKALARRLAAVTAAFHGL
jgi:curved DNA-binding protein CbpA